MERLCLLILSFFWLLQAEAQFTQKGRTLEYRGRKNKTAYTSPVSISFQGCTSTINDKSGNLFLVFPNAKAGNVVSCTELKTSNPQYVIFNRNDFEIWTLGDRILPVVLCEKSKIDNYIAVYTKVQMESSNAKFEAKKRELEQSEFDKQKLNKKIEQLKREHTAEIKEIKENALIFAYIDEERLDSLQYEQHKCILNNDIESAVEIGKQIDFKNNISKQLSNFEKSISKTQEIGMKLFQKAEALYLHIKNCELLSTEKDSLREDYDILIKCYRTLIDQYPNNFKCTEDLYNKIKVKLGNILYRYAELYLDFYPSWTDSENIEYGPGDFSDNDEAVWRVDSLTNSYMREASLYKNANAMLWIVENGENYNERKSYAKELLKGIDDGTLSTPGEYSFYGIKDICESFPDFQIEDEDKILYYAILGDSAVSVAHFHCKNRLLDKIKIPQSVVYQEKKYTVAQIGLAAFGATSQEGDLLKFGIRRGGWKVTNNYFGQDDNMINSETADSDEDKIFSIELPKTIEYIGAGAFFPRLDCVSIKINGIPSRLKILRCNSLMGCESTKKIVIPNNVEIIEEDALPSWKGISISLPKSLRELRWLNGSSGGNFNNSYGKINDINNNPNFRLIDGALYNADSSYVYLGTVGQHNKRLHITRNLKFDEEFLERMHYTTLTFDTEDSYLLDDVRHLGENFVDSICFDDKNPYYSYYEHCIYTKQLDTLLYILPSVKNVSLSVKLKHIAVWDMPSAHYEIPIGMPIEGMKECLDIFSYHNINFNLCGKEYLKKESDSEKKMEISALLDLIVKDNKNNPKLLSLKGLLYLEEDKFYQVYELLDSIKNVGCSNSDYYKSLLDSFCIYANRMDIYIEEYKSIDSNNHDENVERCLKVRNYFNNKADYFNKEIDIYNAFYLNWVLGAQESYSNMRSSLVYMEKGISYALKLVNEFDVEKYRKEVSAFYSSLAKVALYDDDKSKQLQYAQKALELNPNNIEAYEALGTYIYNYCGEDKIQRIRNLIMKVEKIDSNYSNSKNHFLYQLLNKETIYDQ